MNSPCCIGNFQGYHTNICYRRHIDHIQNLIELLIQYNDKKILFKLKFRISCKMAVCLSSIYGN